MKFLSVRQVSLLSAVFCLGLLVFGGYLQFYRGVEPCPLCIIQRLLYFFVGLWFFLGSLYQPQATARRIFYGIAVVLCGAGLGVALHQVHLQHLPPELRPACGADLEVIFQSFRCGMP